MHRFLKKLQHYHSSLGWAGAACFVWAKLTGWRLLFKKKVPGIRHPVWVRIPSTDLSVLKQVLEERHYDFTIPFNSKVIVDAGANIGLSAVFFANRYPQATIIAVEPEASNYEMLVRNTALYPSIKPVRAAIWKESKRISLLDPGEGNHGFQTEEARTETHSQEGMVEGKTIDGLMREFGLEQIDILKLDIEGAEREVLQHCSVWIDRVQGMMVELHDHLKPGCQTAFLEATRDFGEENRIGETVARFRAASYFNNISALAGRHKTEYQPG
jgi:FkbM family methyltransferase